MDEARETTEEAFQRWWKEEGSAYDLNLSMPVHLITKLANGQTKMSNAAHKIINDVFLPNP